MRSSDPAGDNLESLNRGQIAQDATSIRASSPDIDIFDSAAKDELSDVISNIAETWLVNTFEIFESDAFKQLPVIGSVASLVKAGSSIRDSLFARKLQMFMEGVGSIDQRSREKFVQKISSGRATKKVGESLLLLLDKFDDMAKPAILGRIVRAAILGDIEYDESLKLGAIVNRVYLADLLALPLTEKDMGIDFDVAESLASAGLLKRRIESNIYSQQDGDEASLTFYEMNNLGRIRSGFLADD